MSESAKKQQKCTVCFICEWDSEAKAYHQIKVKQSLTEHTLGSSSKARAGRTIQTLAICSVCIEYYVMYDLQPVQMMKKKKTHCVCVCVCADYHEFNMYFIFEWAYIFESCLSRKRWVQNVCGDGDGDGGGNGGSSGGCYNGEMAVVGC